MNITRDPRTVERDIIFSLKDLRKNKKITQTELGERIGVSRDTVARIESGRHRIYLAQVVAIAKELNVRLKDLFQEEAEEQEADETMCSTRQGVQVIYQLTEENSQTSAAPTAVSNPYLREYAVEQYGDPMRKYILNRNTLWWWVPKDKLAGLTIASVVEAVLNYGKENDVAELFQMIGVDKAADIFKHGTSGFRTNYHEDSISYFTAYFNRHVPGYSD